MPVVYLVLHPNADPRAANNVQVRRNDASFNGRAVALARDNGAEVHTFRSGQEATRIISQYSRIDRLIIFAHGAPRWIGFGGGSGGGIDTRRQAGAWRQVRQFAPVLSERLVNGAIVGLAACTCGMSPSDWSAAKILEGQYDTLAERMEEAGGRENASAQLRRQVATASFRFNRAAMFSSVGIDSFAYVLRDQLLVAGTTGVEVRAHMWAGDAVANPHMIMFRPPLHSPGVIMAQALNGVVPDASDRDFWPWLRRWRREWTGEKAEEWILGGPIPEGAINLDTSFVASTDFLPDSQGGTGSIIPSQRTGPLEDSEGTFVESSRSVPPTLVGREEDLLTGVRNWASSMENLLDRRVG